MSTFTLNINRATTPIANNKSYNILPNTITPLSVLDGDFLGSGLDILSIEITATNGTAVVNGTNIDYTPNANYTGTDSFYYRITDSNGAYDIAKVNLTIG